MRILSEANPKVIIEKEELFVDHKAKTRSGHLGHAMVECKDGSILAFYSNCSGYRGGKYLGHTMYGWVEYKRSTDRGVTWGEPTVLQYTYDSFIEGAHFIGCEKAVACDDGTVVVFCLRNLGGDFEPYATPVCLISHDNGYTWSDPVEVHNERGRIYDATYRNGRIYVLEFCNSTDQGFTCNEEGLFYKILVSDDCGKTFSVLSELPFNTMGHAYGNFIFRPDGSLVFYGYNVDDEYNLTCLISEDEGKTWGEPFKSHVAKIARNPQVGYVNGVYVLHARSENGVNFVFYYSTDGINWDEGTIVSDEPLGGCYYSNNIVIKGDDGVERLLVQYSENYGYSRVNVCHAWVICEK